MLVEQETLSKNAKVWVYPSSRKFYPQEIKELTQKLHNFIEGWKSENEEFKASFKLVYQRFIIFLVDENIKLSNKDINEIVTFIIELQQKYEVTLLDRMNVCFKQGKFVQYKELKEFKKLLKNKSVSEKTIVFDNLISTKHDLEHFWEIPITESWYNRFL